MWRRDGARAAALTVLLLAAGAHAQDSVSKANLRPTGPVTIRADKAEWEKGEAMVYTGHVKLASGDLNLTGDRLELHQFPQGQFEAKIGGNPAVLDHKGLRDDAGQPGPPVHAEAKTLTYDSRSQVVEVAGTAVLTRCSDVMKGENIKYNVSKRTIQAEGGTGGQVEFTIDQQQHQQKQSAPCKDATDAGAATSPTAAPAASTAAPAAKPGATP